jgi:hypothetical protein
MAISGESASSPAHDEPGAARRPVSYFTVEKFFCRRLGEFGAQAAEFLADLLKAAAVMPKRYR